MSDEIGRHVKDIAPGGLPLGTFTAQLIQDERAMRELCGPAVLVMCRSTTAARPRPLQRTIFEETDTAETGFTVLPVRKNGIERGGPATPITVGRAPSCDIMIADVTLSKLHAFFRKDGDGFLLEDGGSRNGTLVNGAPVAVRGAGPAVRVPSPSLVRFGSVTVSFLMLPALCEMLRGLVRP